MEDIAVIQLTKDTRERLKSLGSKGETYNEIIERLMERNENAKPTTNTNK